MKSTNTQSKPSETVTTRLPHEMAADLAHSARAQERTVSAELRRAVRFYLNGNYKRGGREETAQ
jgi:muconolactone delta-isomerase